MDIIMLPIEFCNILNTSILHLASNILNLSSYLYRFI